MQQQCARVAEIIQVTEIVRRPRSPGPLNECGRACGCARMRDQICARPLASCGRPNDSTRAPMPPARLRNDPNRHLNLLTLAARGALAGGRAGARVALLMMQSARARAPSGIACGPRRLASRARALNRPHRLPHATDTPAAPFSITRASIFSRLTSRAPLIRV